MPAEGGRLRKRKLLKLPGGDNLYIPVICNISFIDPASYFQETRYSVVNGINADRDVHIDLLHPSADGVVDESQTLPVERIDVWKYIDPDRGQEYRISLDNKTGAGNVPPRFVGHQKTHIFRYYQDPDNPSDDGVWADFELIDAFSVIDPDRYQEIIHTLNNPAYGDASGQVTDDLEDISDDNNGSDGPLRVDPFQNIINFNTNATGAGTAWHGPANYSVTYYVTYSEVAGEIVILLGVSGSFANNSGFPSVWSYAGPPDFASGSCEVGRFTPDSGISSITLIDMGSGNIKVHFVMSSSTVVDILIDFSAAVATDIYDGQIMTADHVAWITQPSLTFGIYYT